MVRNVMVIPGKLRVHICPKVATASISSAMLGSGYHHATANEPGPEFRLVPVRHPLERLVSAWAYFCGDTDRVSKQPPLLAAGYRFGMKFPDFLDIALVKHDEDQHTRMQVEFAGPHEAVLCPLNLLPVVWERLREKLPVLKPLARHHRSSHRPWQEYYTETMQREAERVFAPDVALYGKSINV